MSLIKFIKNNIDTIIQKLEKVLNENKDDFTIVYKPNEFLDFSFKGSGTYGNVLQVTNRTKNKKEVPIGKHMTLKIMKRRSDEPYKIKELGNIINSIKNQYIINKYIIRVYNVDLKEDLIFLEYLEGNTIDGYLKENNLNEYQLSIYMIKALLCIKVFHNLLKYSHRDIKDKNMIYNPENGIMKCIDYGFVCKLRDKKCRNRYQGTGKYIHPEMNKKYVTKKLNNYDFDSTLSMPDSIAQDLFSTIITILKLYYIYKKKKISDSTESSSESNELFDLIIDYEKAQSQKYDYSNRRDVRYKSKSKLFNKIVLLDENNIDVIVVRELVKIIKLHWDFKLNNFSINGKKTILITNFIFDTLISNIFHQIPDSKEKKDLYFDWSIIYSYNLNI